MGGLDIFFGTAPAAPDPVYYPDFPTSSDAGDSPAGDGTLPGAVSSSGWLDKLASIGGTVVDAYKTYSGLQLAKQSVDAQRAAGQAANDRVRLQAQLDSAKLGYSGAAELANAQRAAVQAQGGLSTAALFSSPLVLIAIGVLIYLAVKR